MSIEADNSEQLASSCCRSFVHALGLRLDIPTDIGEAAPMTPPELWGAWRDGVLALSAPVTPPQVCALGDPIQE